MSRKLLLIACAFAAFALSATLAACGSSGGSTGTTSTVAKSGGNTGGEQTTTTENGKPAEEQSTSGHGSTALRSIDACLAAHGIKTPSSPNGTIQVPAGVATEDFDSILRTCAHKAGVQGQVKGKVKTSPPTRQDHKVAFERVLLCLQNHGAGIKKHGKVNAQKLQEAERACRNVLKDTLAEEQISRASLENVHIGKIRIGKIRLGRIHLGKIHIKKLELIRAAGQEAAGQTNK